MSKERLSMMVDCELFNDIKLKLIGGDGWQFHRVLSKDVGLLEADG